MLATAQTLLIISVLATSNATSLADQADDFSMAHMKWPMSADEAEAILSNTNVFAGVHIYLGGRPSPQVTALNVILDSLDALARIDRLASGTNAVGRLYALCGYQVLSRSRYKALRQVLLTIPEQVSTQFGCLGGASPVAELVRDIAHAKLGKEFRRARDELYDYFERTG